MKSVEFPMQFFLDTGLIEEVEEAQSLGLLDGLTTNPSLVAQSGKSREALAREILGRVEGPVSLEVISAEFDGMIQEAKALAAIQENVVVKLPLTTEGIKACRWCTASGIKTNVTLCFSLAGALMAAKNGATYISPFVGRIDDIGQDGLALLAHIKQTLRSLWFFNEDLGRLHEDDWPCGGSGPDRGSGGHNAPGRDEKTLPPPPDHHRAFEVPGRSSKGL